MADVVTVSGSTTVAIDATSVPVRSVWSRHLVGPWHGCRSPSRAYRLWRRANISIRLVHPRPRWGERARVGVMMKSFPPVGRRQPLLEPGGSGRLLAPKGRWAREHRAGALPRQRCSGRLGRIAGRHFPRSKCHAGPVERVPRRRPPGHAHGAQRAAVIVPAQVAGSVVVVVVPRRALAQTRGPPHAGPEGCESVQIPQRLVAVPERPPWRTPGTDSGVVPHHRRWDRRSRPHHPRVCGKR